MRKFQVVFNDKAGSTRKFPFSSDSLQEARKEAKRIIKRESKATLEELIDIPLEAEEDKVEETK